MVKSKCFSIKILKVSIIVKNLFTTVAKKVKFYLHLFVALLAKVFY